jgi:hypothetical protein
MQITLDQTEMETAVVAYIKDQGLCLGSTEPKITFTAGRAPSGMTASIELSNLITITPEAAEPRVAKPKPKPPKVSQTKPEVVNETVDEEEPELVEEESSGTSLFGDADMLTEEDGAVTGDTLFSS